MSVLPVGFGSSGGIDTGDIGHSLRFRSAASAYLNKTFAGAGNLKTWTMSLWVKRGAMPGSAASFELFGTGADNTNDTICYWGPSGTGDQMDIIVRAASVTQGRLTTTQEFRDPTSHMHIVFSYNSPEATAADRMKLYINGVRVTSFATDTQPAQNTDTLWNTARQHYIGRMRDNTTSELDGYLSRVCFVDGQALTPSSFGYLNTEINEWVSKSQSEVKAVVDAGGTNSFMLDFDDATSLTTLGYDKSSKGNNWTLNNFSLTAGTTYDHMLDVPGNSYATLNPLQFTLMSGGSATKTNGNLTASDAGTSYGCYGVGSMPMSAGKWYWETTLTTAGGAKAATGVVRTDTIVSAGTYAGYQYSQAATKVSANAPFSTDTGTAYGATYTAADVIGVALDMDAGTLTFYKNGVSQGQAFSGMVGTYALAVGDAQNGTQYVWNICTGQAPLHASATYDSAAGGYFRYAPPTGYKALCQANLPDPAILNPKLHFDIKTRTGNGTSQTQIGMLFGPGFKWTKDRSAAYNNVLADKVRGANQFLYSNTTGAEATSSGCTFNSDGYTVGSSVEVNNNGSAIVDWLWKAGGAAVSNTAGSITSQVSANVDAGFSIVTYTGTGANATVGHGLGVAPKMIVAKNRTTAYNWPVYHEKQSATPQNGSLYLDLTNAYATNASFWNNTAPTSTTVALGNGVQTNASSASQVLYCFADIEGYSKVFSYTGNGSADGPYVNLGFKPRWILLKCSSTAGNWVVFDTTRNTYNVMGEQLYPNLANAGSTVTTLDVTSRGFKARIATDPNSAQTFIGFAIADVAGKYSLGR